MAERLALDEPPHDPTVDWIWRTWFRLTDDRPHYGGGMGQPIPGRIPWMTLHTWADHHQMTRSELAMLDVCCGEMDAVYLEWWAATQLKEPSA